MRYCEHINDLLGESVAVRLMTAVANADPPSSADFDRWRSETIFRLSSEQFHRQSPLWFSRILVAISCALVFNEAGFFFVKKFVDWAGFGKPVAEVFVILCGGAVLLTTAFIIHALFRQRSGRIAEDLIAFQRSAAWELMPITEGDYMRIIPDRLDAAAEKCDAVRDYLSALNGRFPTIAEVGLLVDLGSGLSAEETTVGASREFSD